MGKVIANRTIKMMNKKGHGSKDSLITILGLTFKEDVPDLRNSKVKDIVDKLLSFDVNLQLHDAYAEHEMAQSMFHIGITNFEDINPANAIILTVVHQAYTKTGLARYCFSDRWSRRCI